MYLASMTWHEFHEATSDDLLALVPLGSTEQHGSIGPLGTDFAIPEEMARRLEAQYPDRLVVLPTMPYGVCPYHTEFSGTIDIGTAALQSVMTSVAEHLMNAGVRRFAFLNGHGGNDPALEAACLRIYERGGLGAILDWWTIARELDPRWGGGHGGGQEAAVMMALRPDWVRKEKNFVPEEDPVADAGTEKRVRQRDRLQRRHGEDHPLDGRFHQDGHLRRRRRQLRQGRRGVGARDLRGNGALPGRFRGRVPESPSAGGEMLTAAEKESLGAIESLAL